MKTSDLERTQNNLNICLAFLTKYEHLLAKSSAAIHVDYCFLSVPKEDAALLGEIFGKDCWTRELAYGGETFHWTTTIDGINIRINHAESMDLNKTPVPPKAFPVMLEDTEQDA